MRTLLLAGLSLGLAGWSEHAVPQLFSSTGPVIAIFDGELLVGEATGHVGGRGTIALKSASKAGLTCTGVFSYSQALGDGGELTCSDGASAAFRFQRVGLKSGHGEGVGTSGGAFSFTYGLSPEDSAPYLKLPPGKALRRERDRLELVAAPLPPP